MDTAEKMILEDLRQETKTINRNILYLCTKCASTDTRLKNIEENMLINDKNTEICLNKVNRVEGKIIGVCLLITITLSSFIGVLV